MRADYLPRSDAELAAWLVNYKARLLAHGASLGFDPGAEIPAMVAAIDAWIADYYAHVAAHDLSKSARAKKDGGRKSLISGEDAAGGGGGVGGSAGLRAAVHRLHAATAMTDSLRALFGISVRDRKPTAAPLPESCPLLTIRFGTNQAHEIHYRDKAHPTRRAKPKGVHHLEIWCKKGGALPTTDAEWTYLAIDTATPFVNRFDLEDVGTVIYYRARWVNTRGEVGPWSGVARAVVPG